jgi:hypothetical protein
LGTATFSAEFTVSTMTVGVVAALFDLEFVEP